MSDLAISIRRPQAPAEYAALQQVQRQAWNLADDTYVVPVATLVGADRHGGVVLGAFLDDGRAVGVSFAFLARIRGRLGLYSQLTGVAPGFQGQGIGRRLKQGQRTVARVQDLPVIAWAFDPLQAANAWFNLTVLGAQAHAFVPDMYGPRTDRLNAGTPTDRLIVEWEVHPSATSHTHSLPVKQHGPAHPAVGEPHGPHLIALGPDGPVFSGHAPAGEPCVLLEIPPQIGSIRAHQPELAQAWQTAMRLAFQAAFAAGYVATSVLKGHGDPDAFHYVLEPVGSASGHPPTVISGPDNRSDLRRA